MLLPFALILPLLFTVLIEWIVSLFFKLKPSKYVVIINFITNPILNILLFFIYAYNKMNYIPALIIFEAVIMGIEFWFYTRKYKEYSKIRLFIFSLAANAASWGLYWLFTMLIGL